MLKKKNIVRDLVFLALLVSLCQNLSVPEQTCAGSTSYTPTHTTQRITTTVDATHEHTQEQLAFANATQAVHGQIKLLLKIIDTSERAAHEHLEAYDQKLNRIQQHYEPDSPLSFLLGPLSYFSSGLKEHELTTLANKVNRIAQAQVPGNKNKSMEYHHDVHNCIAAINHAIRAIKHHTP